LAFAPEDAEHMKGPTLEQQAAGAFGQVLASLATAAIAVFLVRSRVGATWRDLGMSPPRIHHDLLLGAAAYAMISVPVYAIHAVVNLLIEYRHPLIDIVRDSPSPWFWVVTALAAVVAAPIFEELCIRGLLLPWLDRVLGQLRRRPSGDDAARPIAEAPVVAELSEQGKPPIAESVEFEPVAMRWTSWLAILLSSAVFALLHWGQGGAPFALFFFAVGMGYVYHRTRRLLAVIVAHGLFNGVALIVLAVEMSNR